MADPHVVILGAGPAGVGAAYKLRRRGLARVTVIEQQSTVGGNAGSFEAGGQRLDYGSHRLHPACDPEILRDIRSLLGNDLLDRPRHGRIRLRGKWIHFPLKPLDLLLRLDRRFAAGTALDITTRKTRRHRSDSGEDSFASVLMASLGRTICEEFYFPYARKIWGREPEELSGIQARRRVSAGSFGKLMRKVLSQIPGLNQRGAGRFFYPRNGYGEISEAYADAARNLGAEFLLEAKVTALQLGGGIGGRGWTVSVDQKGRLLSLDPDYVWSTIPITLLTRLVCPAPEARVLEAASSMEYRAMLLIYLELDEDRFTEYDAHYFPGADIRITRLSEPKNYSLNGRPGRTTLCAELPCSPDDHWWKMSDYELGTIVAEDLARAGLPLRRNPVAVHAKRLRHAYPVYTNGYEKPFGILASWVEGLPNLLSYGRQGLFAHDNTHHALFMAYSAADCLTDGVFDHAKWEDYRRNFATHVVED